MTLIVEDGSGSDPEANTYSDLAALRAYALSIGVTLATEDIVVEGYAHVGMQYIERRRAQYQGCKTAQENPLQFPRIGMQIDGFDIADDVIPMMLPSALGQLVVEQHNGINIMPTEVGAFVTEDTLGPITTKFSDLFGDERQPGLVRVEGFLAILYSTAGTSLLRTVRI